MTILRRVFALETNVLAISVTAFFILVPRSAWFLVLPFYLEDLGATTIDIGITYALLNLVWNGLQLPGGLLADRYSRKLLIVLPTLFLAVCYIVAGTASTWWVLALALILSDSLSALQMPSFISTIAESVSEEHRGTAFATFMFFSNMGFVLGPLIGAVLIPLYGYKPLLYITGIACGISGIVRLFFIHETRQRTREEGKESILLRVKEKLLWLLIGIAFYAMAFGLTTPLIPMYAERIIGLSFVEIEWMYSVAQFTATFSSFLVGKLVDRIGSKLGLVIAFLAKCLSTSIWAFSPSFLVAIILLSISYVFATQFWISHDSLIPRIATSRTIGATLGITNLVFGASNGIGSAAGSCLWEGCGPTAPFLLTGVFGILSAFSLVKLKVPHKESFLKEKVG